MKINIGSIVCIILCIVMIGIITCRSQENVAENITSKDFAVIEYDSCEYVIRDVPYKGFLAHKGNCKYCEKRNKR